MTGIAYVFCLWNILETVREGYHISETDIRLVSLMGGLHRLIFAVRLIASQIVLSSHIACLFAQVTKIACDSVGSFENVKQLFLNSYSVHVGK